MIAINSISGRRRADTCIGHSISSMRSIAALCWLSADAKMRGERRRIPGRRSLRRLAAQIAMPREEDDDDQRWLWS